MEAVCLSPKWNVRLVGECRQPDLSEAWISGMDEGHAQITFSLHPISFVFCQSVTFLADIVHGIMVVILSLTRKATKNIK